MIIKLKYAIVLELRKGSNWEIAQRLVHSKAMLNNQGRKMGGKMFIL